MAHYDDDIDYDAWYRGQSLSRALNSKPCWLRCGKWLREDQLCTCTIELGPAGCPSKVAPPIAPFQQGPYR